LADELRKEFTIAAPEAVVCSPRELNAVLTAVANIGTQNTVHSVIVTGAGNKSTVDFAQHPPHDCKVHFWTDVMSDSDSQLLRYGSKDFCLPGADKFEDTDMAALCFSSGTTGGTAKAVSLYYTVLYTITWNVFLIFYKNFCITLSMS
jgi:acyl-CoA synthetase (AMP-forming)/AMP-acid ligase II